MVTSVSAAAQPRRRRPSQQLIFPAFCACLSLALVAIVVDSAFGSAPNPLYTTEAVMYGLLASVLLFVLSFRRSIVTRLFCVLLSVFYTQRFITTYLAPNELDYERYRSFTRVEVEASARYYFFCALAICIGGLVGDALTRRRAAIVANSDSSGVSAYITFFPFKVSFEQLARVALIAFIAATIFNFRLLASGFGIAGSVYDQSETVLRWFTSIASYLSPFVVFALLYFRENRSMSALAKWAFALMLITNLWGSSKGTLMALALTWYLVLTLLGRPLPKRFFAVSGFVIVLSIFVFFPAMSILRTVLLTGTAQYDYLASLAEARYQFLSRLGGFDWLNLWISTPADQIPPNASALGELISLVNRIVPGEIIPQPDAVDLSKLMVVLGRGVDIDLKQLGGGAENVGGPATAYLFLGPIGGLIYLTILPAILIAVERSSLHPMHKTQIIYFYVVIFVIGGGSVILQGSFFWFLVLTTFLAGIVWLVSPARLRSSRKKQGDADQTRVPFRLNDPEPRN